MGNGAEVNRRNRQNPWDDSDAQRMIDQRRRMERRSTFEPNPNILVGGNPIRRTVRGIRWNYLNYKQAILQILNKLYETRVGQIVLSAISRKVMIIPLQTGNTAGPLARAAFNVLLNFTGDSSLNGIAARSGCPQGTILPENPQNACVGGGTEAIIEFTPGMYVQGDPLHSSSSQNMNVDEILLHELIHALRITKGVWAPIPLTGPLMAFNMVDEFYAVLITNIYRSAHSRTPLRRDYTLPYNVLSNSQNTVFHRSQRMLRNLRRDLPDMTRRLSQVRCDFNPLREIYTVPLQLDIRGLIQT